MTVLDEIRKLDEKKAQLLDSAKKEALDKARTAVEELRELGFNYRLVQSDDTGTPAVRSPTGRRTGIRDDVLKAIKAFPKITRADLLVKMDVKGDKSGEQSVSNALAALKKAGTITAEGNQYSAA